MVFRRTHNIRVKNILELPIRRKIYGIVNKYAGCHFREIERKSRLSTGLVKYHLDYLTKHDIIRQEKIGNNVRYFTKDLSDEEKKILSLLRTKNYRGIIICLISNGKSSHKKISDFIGLSPSTVSWHLKRLAKEGVINSSEKGYVLQIEKNKIIKLLITYRESFLDSLVDRTIEMWDV